MLPNARHDHDELRAIMKRFARMMRNGSANSHGELLQERVRFSQFFAAHLAAERADLDRLAPSAPRTVRERIEEYHDRIAALRRDYSAHVNHWTPVRIREAWDDYVAAVSGLQKHLHDLMAWEERELAPA